MKRVLLNPHPSPLSLHEGHLRPACREAGGGDNISSAEGVGGWGARRVRLAAIALSVLLTVVLAGPAAAQEPTPSADQVNAIAKQLYCPVCENVPLDVCPTQACEQWRATIREKLTLGWSEQQIKDYFVAQYGDRVLATPPPRGFNWLVYILPPLALAAAGIVLWQTMRRWQRAGAQAPPTAAPPDTDPYVQRLEEELKRRG